MSLICELNKIVDNFKGYTSESFHEIPWGKAAEVYCDFNSSLDDLLSSYGFSFIGKGRQRRVYKRGNLVLKIPHNIQGEFSNSREASTYRKYKNNIYAPCKKIDKYLFMLYVEPLSNNYPDWAENIDCYQVGKLKSGKIVAYDYGY